MGHGGNIYEIQRKYNIEKNKLIDFSSNINPLGLPKTLKKIIMSRMDDLEAYPDIHYYQLKTAISKYYSLDIDNIFVGNGAAQVIYDIIHGIKPKDAIVLAPTFSEYERALNSSGSNIIHYYLKEEDDFQLIPEDFIKIIDDSIDLIVLCNPNNPTSKLINIKTMESILEKAKKHKTFVMIDEAFMDFVKSEEDYSMLKMYRDYNNLIIVRAFTKFYAIPGLRLGFGITCNKDILNRINNTSLPWSLNTFAGYFGEVLLTEDEYVDKTHKWLEEEKARFVAKLKEIRGIKVYEPAVNFILIKIIKDNIDVDILKEEFLKESILIRDCSNFKGLDKKFFRIAIKAPSLNDGFIKVLKKIIQNN
ncbi:MAG: threonine-phosphate decarboxylase [Clostridiales bacterium]|nr:threonine-phosphate decarboxylase [Clostridiales bacterium]